MTPSINYIFVPGSSRSKICVLNVLMILQFTQCAGNEFQLLITLLLNINFLKSSLNLLLKNLLSCPLRLSSSVLKNMSLQIAYLPFIILYVSIKAFLSLLFSNHVKPKYFNRSSYLIFPIPSTNFIAHQLPLNTCNQLSNLRIPYTNFI